MTAGGAVRSACGVLVAWSTFDSSASSALAWNTRDFGFDAQPLAPAISHPSLSVATTDSASLSLATDGAQIGALDTDDMGCRFGRLDEEGHDVGSAVTVGPGYCTALAVSQGGWSLLQAHAVDATTPVTLDVIDESNQVTEATLATPPFQILLERLTFDDGSFLLHTLDSNDNAWVEPFDSTGMTLGAPVAVSGSYITPTSLVATRQSALEISSSNGLLAIPVDRTGNPTEPQVQIDPRLVFNVTQVPMPDGDVLLAWAALDPDDTYPLFVATVDPSGALRAPPTQITGAFAQQTEGHMFGVVDASGSRALLVTDQLDVGVQAIPLTCAR